MAAKKFLYLSRASVEKVGVPMTQIIENLEAMFIEKSASRVEMPPKPGIHPLPDAFIHAMPAFIPKLKAAGIKWVSGFPQNLKKNLPYISGLIILNSIETGVPICVMDCTWVTAKRTGAATAVAAKHLARKNSQILGILGCGVQGLSNSEALHALFPIERIRAYDINNGAARRFRERIQEQLKIEVEIVSSPEQAVRESDLVVTAGPIFKNPNPVIEENWFKVGAFASAVDFDSYWKPEVFHKADKFCTDDIPQMMYYKSIGYFQTLPQRVLELGDLVSGKIPGREREEERNICVNLGLALDDIATAPLIYKRALALGIGQEIEL